MSLKAASSDQLFFAIYLNDLPSQLSNKSELYADDSKVMAAIKSLEDVLRLQADLDALSTWCRVWMMVPNTNKCKVMHIGKQGVDIPARMYHLTGSDGTRVELSSTIEERDLGIILTSLISSSVPRQRIRLAMRTQCWASSSGRSCRVMWKSGPLCTKRTFVRWSSLQFQPGILFLSVT